MARKDDEIDWKEVIMIGAALVTVIDGLVRFINWYRKNQEQSQVI